MKKNIIYILFTISICLNLLLLYNYIYENNKEKPINKEIVNSKSGTKNEEKYVDISRNKELAFYHPAFWDMNGRPGAVFDILDLKKKNGKLDPEFSSNILIDNGVYKFPLEIIFEETYEKSKGKPWELHYIDGVPLMLFTHEIDNYLKDNIDKFSKENLETQKEIFEKAFNSISEKNFGETVSFDSIERIKENLSNIIKNINEKLKSL
ncbi:hypothetical protein DLH72_01380 [Candidatus Gracilibacteria bacterium]|nr:MAG: hypothetical protein DLH72_01380 [Candidatus Gracilibacteria bacterium]